MEAGGQGGCRKSGQGRKAGLGTPPAASWARGGVLVSARAAVIFMSPRLCTLLSEGTVFLRNVLDQRYCLSSASLPGSHLPPAPPGRGEAGVAGLGMAAGLALPPRSCFSLKQSDKDQHGQGVVAMASARALGLLVL